MKCRLYVGEKKNPPKLSLVGIIWILSWFRSNKFFRSIAKCLISKQYVYLIFSLLSSWLIFLIRETPKATVRRMKLILHPWISTELLHSSCFSILNGTGRVQELSMFDFINHRKSLTSDITTTNEQQIKMLGFGNEGHMKIWLDSHVILWREGKYTSMYKYVLHRPFCVWLKAKNSNCVSSWIKHYFKCKISQSLATEGPWWMLKFKTRETPKIRNRELYSYYHHFIRILVWYRNK